MSNGMVEIIGGRERRRRWGAEEKLRIVGETLEAGACVRAVAARHDVYPGLLHYWRRQVREGRLGSAPPARFVPVGVAAAQSTSSVLPLVNNQHGGETIEIVLPNGCRVRIGNEASLLAPRRVLTALRG